MTDKFIDLKDISSSGGMKISHAAPGSVIKNDAIKDGGGTRKIIHHAARASVKPIIENEIVIGVSFKCACGETTKVYFQYDQTP